MRHFGLLRTTISISSCMLICFVSSCVKDNFDSHQNASVKVAFDVEVSDSWVNCASQAATGTSIKKMSQTDDFEPLYLVTDISDLPAGSSGQQPATRGTAVTGANFPDVFGLSAICYTEDWPSSDEVNDWPVNFAYNLKVQKNSKGVWEPEEARMDGIRQSKILCLFPLYRELRRDSNTFRQRFKGNPDTHL